MKSKREFVFNKFPFKFFGYYNEDNFCFLKIQSIIAAIAENPNSVVYIAMFVVSAVLTLALAMTVIVATCVALRPSLSVTLYVTE